MLRYFQLRAALFLLLPLLLVSQGAATAAETSGGKVGQSLPAMTVINLSAPDKGVLDLDAFKGKVVILGFWQGYCPSCLVELPQLKELYQKYSDKGLETALINVGGDQATIEGVAANSGLPFIIAFDKLSLAAAKMGVGVYPTYFVLNRDGNIVARIVGPGQSATLVKEVEKQF